MLPVLDNNPPPTSPDTPFCEPSLHSLTPSYSPSKNMPPLSLLLLACSSVLGRSLALGWLLVVALQPRSEVQAYYHRRSIVI